MTNRRRYIDTFPPLDPRVYLLDLVLSAAMRPVWTYAPEELEEARKWMPSEPLLTLFYGPNVPLDDVYDLHVSGRHGAIPIRIFSNTTSPEAPLIVFAHGGGWMFGNIDSYDRVCRRLAFVTGAVIASVGYRLAPEHRYPTPLEDVFDAIQWLTSNAGKVGAHPDRCFVMGDSAGGNLVASSCLLARDLGAPPPRGQILIYPITDATSSQPSMAELAHAPVLTRRDVEFCAGMYARHDQDLSDPYMSPLLAKDHSGLPPALIITANVDPLRDEGAAYADALLDAEVDTIYMNIERSVHGFLSLPWWCAGSDESLEATRDFLARYS